MLHDTYPVFFNFWRPSRYCSSSNHYVLRDSQQFRLIVFSPKARHSFILVSSEGPSHQVGTMISSVHASQ